MKSILIVYEWQKLAHDYAILRERVLGDGFVYMDAIRRREDNGNRFKIEHFRLDEDNSSELIETLYSELDMKL